MASQITVEQFADRLCALMHKMTGKLLSLDRNYLARGLITMPQLFVLHQIAEAGQCSMSLLARNLGFKCSTITGLVDRLVALGLARRHSPETNRRQVLAEITPKGARILAQVRAERRRVLIGMFKLVSAQERAVYLSIIEKIAAQISQSSGGK
jgi:DNA-binding MarR family transcriptional regulator